MQNICLKNLKLLQLNAPLQLIRLLYVPIICVILSYLDHPTFQAQLPIYLTLSTNSAIRISAGVYVADQLGFRKYQLSMGVSKLHYVLAWLFSTLALYFLAGFIYIFPVLIGGAQRPSIDINFFLALSTYVWYIIASANLNLVICAIFSNSKIAAEAIGVINLFLSLIFLYAEFQDFSQLSFWYQMPYLLIPQSTIQLIWISYNTDSYIYGIKTGIYIGFQFAQILLYILLYFTINYIQFRQFRVFPRSNQVFEEFQDEDLEQQQHQQLSLPFLQIQEQYTSRENQLLEVKDLKVKISQRTLSKLNLSVGVNEIYCLLGPNGSGKSTIIQTLAGQLQPLHGQILINGSVEHSQHKKGLCLQDDVLYENLTVREHIEFYKNVKQDPSSVDELSNRFLLTNILDFKAHQLSLGNKRKLTFALSSLGNPSVIFLDDPTCGLDILSKNEVYNLIKILSQGRCIVFSTQDSKDAESVATNVGVLIHGEIVAQGTLEHIIKTFGVGMNVMIEILKPAQFEESCSKVYQYVSAYIPNCGFEKLNNLQIKIVIPQDSAGQCGRFLSFVENSIQCKYSIFTNTLEDSYLNIETLFGDQINLANIFNPFLEPSQPNPLEQFKALLIRKWLSTSTATLFYVLVVQPFIMMWLAAAFQLHPFIFLLIYFALRSVMVVVYMHPLLKEQEVGLTQQILTSGVPFWLYYLSNLTYDAAPCLIEALYTAGFLYGFKVGIYWNYPFATFFMLFLLNLSLLSVAAFFMSFFKRSTILQFGVPIVLLQLYYILPIVLMFMIVMDYSQNFFVDFLGWLLMILSPFMSGLMGLAHSPDLLSKFFYSYPSCVCWLIISGTFYSFVAVRRESSKFKQMTRQPQDESCMIKAVNVSYAYANAPALAQLNFEVKKGEIYGLLGPNGAGKTTTFSLLTGLDNPIGGELFMRCENSSLGLVPSKKSFYEDLSARENLLLFGRLKGQQNLEQQVDSYLQQLSLDRLSGRKLKTLSVGEQQKVLLGCGLIGGSRVLILDEPTRSMDPRSRKAVHFMLRQAQQQGATIMLTTHSMHEAQSICNRIGIVINGTMRVEGTLDQLRKLHGDAVGVYILCQPTKKEQVKQAIGEKFSQFYQLQEIISMNHDVLSYHILQNQLRLSAYFEFMSQQLIENWRLVREFQIYHTSLEQIFSFYCHFQFKKQEMQVQNQCANMGDICRLASLICCLPW